jgi:hypothetical protein
LGSWAKGKPPALQALPVATASDIYLDSGQTLKSSDQVMSYLKETLLPGDILYLGDIGDSGDVITNYKNANLADATHAITWINNCSSASPLAFVSLPSSAPGAGGSSPSPFVIDSTGSESSNYLGQAYPNGVQAREFTSEIWYFKDIIGVSRWLTPTNVATLAQQL